MTELHNTWYLSLQAAVAVYAFAFVAMSRYFYKEAYKEGWKRNMIASFLAPASCGMVFFLVKQPPLLLLVLLFAFSGAVMELLTRHAKRQGRIAKLLKQPGDVELKKAYNELSAAGWRRFRSQFYVSSTTWHGLLSLTPEEAREDIKSEEAYQVARVRFDDLVDARLANWPSALG